MTRASEPWMLFCSLAQARADLFVVNAERLSRVTVPGMQFVTLLERAPL